MSLPFMRGEVLADQAKCVGAEADSTPSVDSCSNTSKRRKTVPRGPGMTARQREKRGRAHYLDQLGRISELGSVQEKKGKRGLLGCRVDVERASDLCCGLKAREGRESWPFGPKAEKGEDLLFLFHF
jgi:hypothetical protein